MPRLWPLLVALPALVLWLAELSISASSQSAQAEQQAAAYAARAVDAVGVRVAARRAELQALTLRLSASPATWATLEALRAGKADLAAERMGAVRRVAQDAVSTGLRGALVLGVRADAGGSYVHGADSPGPTLSGVQVDVLAGAGSDGQTRDAFGVYDLFFSVPLTGSDKDAHALGTLVVGGPLLPDGTADGVSLEMGLAAVGFITSGKLVASGGPDRGVLPVALRETPVGKSAAAVRGSAGGLGPLKLPVWTGGEPALRIAVRRSLPGQPVEVLAVASVEPFMSTLADTQRFAFSSMLGLLVLLGAALAWTGRSQPARAPRSDEDTLPPPRRTTPPRPFAVRAPEAAPAPAAVEALPAPLPPPPAAPAPAADSSVFDAAPAGLGGAVLDFEPPPTPLSRLPPPPPVQDLSALLDAMPPPPPPRTPPPSAQSSMHRTPSAPIGGRFPAARAAPPPPPLDSDHQPTTAYPIPELPDFNAPPSGFAAVGPLANAIPDTTRVADIPPELLQAARPVTTPVPRPRGAPAPASGPDEEHFQAVYRDFVAQRQECGESADGLTYERFAQKLRKNRDQLISKYSCRTVRFSVYVKDGKAALKATPVKD